jgi:tetratricopeptide (TPR) repeat protein
MLAVLALGVATHIRTFVWSDRLSAVLIDAKNHPESPRASMAVGTAYARLSKAATDVGEKVEFRDVARSYFQKAADLRPESPNGLLAMALLYYEQGAIPPPPVELDLKRRLSSGRIDASTANGLKAMTECLLKEVCKVDEGYYLAALDGAFLNPRIADSYASYVLRLMARFHAERKGDHDLAIMLVKRAMELNPGQFEIRLELIENLVMGGYLAQAARELDELERTDRLKKYGTLSASWRRQIESHLSSSVRTQL